METEYCHLTSRCSRTSLRLAADQGVRWQMKLLLPLVALLFLSACSGQQSLDEEVESSRKTALKGLDVYGCIMEGKAVVAVGMFATPACIDIYSDGGKPCQGGKDCEGSCITDAGTPPGTIVVGRCASSEKDYFGCYAGVGNGGVVMGTMCQD